MSRGYWTSAINYFPVERNSEGIQEKIVYYGYFSNFTRRKCIISDVVPVPRAVEFKMATGCKFRLYRYVTRTNVPLLDH